MAKENFLNDPYVDTRTEAEKREGMRNFLLTSGSIAGYLLIGRKMAITRGISKDIRNAGMHGETNLQKYLMPERKIRSSRGKKGFRESAKETAQITAENTADAFRSVFTPAPSDAEMYRVQANLFIKKYKYSATSFPAFESFGTKNSSWFKRNFIAPQVVAYTPGTTLGVAKEGHPRTTGEHGAMLIQDKLYYMMHPKKGSIGPTFVPGMRAGLSKSPGTALERDRRGIARPVNPLDTKSYIKQVELNPQTLIAEEKPMFWDAEYRARYFPSRESVANMRSEEARETLLKYHSDIHSGEAGGIFGGRAPRTPDGAIIPELDQFMRMKVNDVIPHGQAGVRDSMTFQRQMLLNAAKAREAIANKASKSGFAKARYGAFKLSRFIGIGEEFAHAPGVPQQAEKLIREGAGWNYTYPGRRAPMPVTSRRYEKEAGVLGARWFKEESSWYITNPEDTSYRIANLLSTGTFHKVGEKAFGIGITNRRSTLTELARKAVGSKKGSWSDLWIRNVGKTSRGMLFGIGAAYTFNFINFLARESIGWGPNDLAADSYVHLRELQQRTLDNLGVVDAARKIEKAFPGVISSPLSYAARLAAPVWMAKVFEASHGRTGYKVGLAMGVATALITWGDLTQSPEELHRIFTGEQEVPVRKGRFWLLGKTPFFGGKISYWRPHWYPMMKAGYGGKSQLWESEREYWAQGTFMSPILAPILTGQKWDPYYWEKKHYKDRPYMITGELFEPTMPFAWLGNMTLGRIIKPPRLMHSGTFGKMQDGTAERDRGVPPDAADRLGFSEYPRSGMNQAQNPYSWKYQLGMAAYVQAEQMGLSGFILSTMIEQLTGRKDFASSQGVVETSRRATGYERWYWEKELGDPGAGLDEGLTEYYRRILPHKRNNTDAYNPTTNEMPDWMPGDNYYINFRQGDPYIKVPFGELRLPGAGYESTHKLHSGTPGVYDPVDRFLILSNVAPYSQEYKQYRSMAVSMTRDDPEWFARVNTSMSQRAQLSKEYDFLSLSTEGVEPWLKGASSKYRHALASITHFPNPLETIFWATRMGPVPTHLNKWLPYRTAEATYEDDRLLGSDFAGWEHPIEGFVSPFMRKIRRRIDGDYVPSSVKNRRDVDEYFDKIKYIKYQNLAKVARDQGDMELTKKMSRIVRTTVSNQSYGPATAFMSIPRGERGFYEEFSQAEGDRRDEILSMVSPSMRNYYKAAWNKNDGTQTYDIDYQTSADNVAYFKTHHLPGSNWAGWRPDVSLDQVKLRTVKNDAMDIHKFNLWESQERELARQPFVPVIENMNAPTSDMTMLQNAITSNMERYGIANPRVTVSRTPAMTNTHNITLNLTRDITDDHEEAMTASLSSR
jgi:hypothetical protein